MTNLITLLHINSLTRLNKFWGLNDKKILAYLYRSEANVLMNDGKHAQSLDDFLKGLKNWQRCRGYKQGDEIEGTSLSLKYW